MNLISFRSCKSRDAVEVFPVDFCVRSCLTSLSVAEDWPVVSFAVVLKTTQVMAVSVDLASLKAITGRMHH